MNKKKIFICGDFKFPKGDAVSNRMHYIAKSLEESGAEVMIISAGDNRVQDWVPEEKKYTFDGIIYENVKRRQGNGFDFIMRGLRTSQILSKYGIAQNDAIFISSIWPHYTTIIRKKTHKVNPEFYFDVMEWFQPYQFKCGRFSLWYKAYNYYFEKIANSGKKVMVISEELEKYYLLKNKKVLCMPMVLSPSAYPCLERTNFEFINLIYPGNPGKKDAFNIMLRGLTKLDMSSREKIRFHITGVTREKIVDILGKESQLLIELDDIIIFHEWLEYSDLYNLYNKMHFFLLAKEDTLLSRSNFPSKVPELMSCGVVPIINNVGDISNYLNDGINSLMYNNCDALDCAAAISRAISTSRYSLKEMSRNSRLCSEEKFDYKMWQNRLVEFFELSGGKS